MKKTITVIVLFAIAVGAFVFSYQYRNQKITQQLSDTAATSVMTSKEDNTATAEGTVDSSLLAEDKENDYQVYFNNNVLTIVHGEYKKEVYNWTDYWISLETPTIYCKDYDGDGEKELLIKRVNGRLEKKYDINASPFTYALYLFKPTITSTGEKTMNLISTNSQTWKAPFESAIKCELTQLKSCDKFLQFTMDDAVEKIVYDEKTGITSNEHVGYTLSLYDNSKNYYTLSRWSKGAGIYNIDDDGDMTLDIQVLANYEEVADTQCIGNIHCKMAIIDGKFNIAPKTIVFYPLDKYKITDPRNSAKKKWTCVISNESTNTNFKNTDIDWIESELSLKNTSDKSSQSFETLPSKIKCVDSVTFTEDSVVLTAKKGYSFSKAVADSGKFSVILNIGDEEYDVSYSCDVKTDSNTSILTIKLDKTYDKEDFDKVLIKFGV